MTAYRRDRSIDITTKLKDLRVISSQAQPTKSINEEIYGKKDEDEGNLPNQLSLITKERKKQERERRQFIEGCRKERFKHTLGRKEDLSQ